MQAGSSGLGRRVLGLGVGLKTYNRFSGFRGFGGFALGELGFGEVLDEGCCCFPCMVCIVYVRLMSLIISEVKGHGCF